MDPLDANYRFADYPVTGKYSQSLEDGLFSRLVSVSVEEFLEPVSLDNGCWSLQVTFAHVVARDNQGNIWTRCPKVGEDEHDIAKALAARGYTTGAENLN
jgi:hypothetical protein